MPRFGHKRAKLSVITLADQARDQGQWDLAAEYYRIALYRKPENPPVWVQYGHVLKESGKLREAEVAYRRAISYGGAGADSYLQLGHVLKMQKKDEAEAAYLRALTLDPLLNEAAWELALYGWDDARLLALRRSCCTEPRLLERRRRRGDITVADRARDGGQWELAARHYRRALDRNPQNAPIWVQYGHVLKESGHLAEAERAYRTAVACDPRSADPHLQLGRILKIQSKTVEARAAYLRAFVLEPSLESISFELEQLGWSEPHFAELRGMLGIDAPIGAPFSSVNSISRKNSASSTTREKPAGKRQNDFKFHLPHQSRASRLRIVVLGYLIRGPSGGLAWHYLNYVLGLAELGHDVYFIEDSGDGGLCWDRSFSYCSADSSYGLCFASNAFTRLGLGCRWAYYDGQTKEWRGARASDARELCGTADLILNISGKTVLRDWFERVPVRAFIDTDPGFTQIQNLTDPVFRRCCEEHTAFFSFGENIGKPCSLVPADGLAWKPTRQPVSLDGWPSTASPCNGRYTTVMMWESYATQIYKDLLLATKSESFPPFADLPRRLGERFELAIGGGSPPPLSALRAAGWRIADIDAVIRDPWTYQAFIQASKAEFGIAKQGYVATHSGWFSERSAVYLASGRPVLAQDTGFREWLPCGEGVLVFRSADDVVDAISRIEADYDAHCCAARELAVEYFAARRVLPALIEAAMAPPSVSVRESDQPVYEVIGKSAIAHVHQPLIEDTT